MIYAIEINNEVFFREAESERALKEHLMNLDDGTTDFNTVTIRLATEAEIDMLDDPNYCE